jgi:hypothetical protein
MNHEQHQVEATRVLIDWYSYSAHGQFCLAYVPLGHEVIPMDPLDCCCHIKRRSEAQAKVLDEAGLLCGLYVRPSRSAEQVDSS